MIICCFGDSLTLGFADPSGKGWPGRLCAALMSASRGVSCYNLGIRADASPRIRVRWHAEASARLKARPAGLVFCFGTADAAQAVAPEESFAACREILSRAPELAPTLLLTPPPVIEPEVNERIRSLAAGFLDMAKELRVPYFDLFAALEASGTYKAALKRGDGAHPDGIGYDKMAEKLLCWSPLRSMFLAETT
ncbi:MAG: GDSL-type esterase/lipase family protein [Desulfovibrio sp.]